MFLAPLKSLSLYWLAEFESGSRQIRASRLSIRAEASIIAPSEQASSQSSANLANKPPLALSYEFKFNPSYDVLCAGAVAGS